MLIALVVAAFVWVLYNKTRFGKNIYAIGGNPEATKVSGVNVARNLIMMYVFAGVLYGLAGCLEAARTGGATNNYGNMYELDAIAAAVVGGVSTSGGIGTVPGIMVGVLIFSVINYGLTFIGMSPYLQAGGQGRHHPGRGGRRHPQIPRQEVASTAWSSTCQHLASNAW